MTRRVALRTGCLLSKILMLLQFSVFASAAPEANVLPKPETQFQGELGMVVEESTGGWPERIEPPQGAPNVLLVMTDDEGFAASSVYGGPIPRPTLERLAQQGLRYNAFHTNGICSPTRASLLTGRNAHAVRTGNVVDIATPYPGYWSNIPNSAATIARTLRDNGYNTAMFGKDHNVPSWERSAAGPFDRWPTGMGFEYFFGFVGGDMNHWHPSLFRNTSRVTEDVVPAGETLEHALASDAIHWIHNQQAAHSGKPFFVYYATGTPHAPHQAPREWIDRFEGQFDDGWDRLREKTFARQQQIGLIPANAELTPRPAEIPAWDSLTETEKRVARRMMEVAAGTIAYQDAQLGRIIAELDRMGELDNTLVVFITGDNGASGEAGLGGTLNELAEIANGIHDDTEFLAQSLDIMGGPWSYQSYPVGWAWALNTPLQWVKQVASHLGGVRNGLVVSWPEQIDDHGGVRSQFTHVTDVMPTILDVAGIEPPSAVDGVEQQRIDGTSFAYTFGDAAAEERHARQYFESQGNRAIYDQGWWANTVPRRMPWEQQSPAGRADEYEWELYHLTEDYSQANNVADQYPQKLQALQQVWLAEARRNNVLPLDDSFGFEKAKPMIAWRNTGRNTFVYWGSGIQVEDNAAPSLAGRGFSISIEADISKNNATGVLVSYGSRFGGWSFYLKDGRPVAYQAASTQPEHQYRIAAHDSVPAGHAVIRYEFTPSEPGLYQGGSLKIFVNGREVAAGRVDRTIARPAGLGETFDIGFDAGAPVSADYQDQGRFPGEIRKVEVVLDTMKLPASKNEAA